MDAGLAGTKGAFNRRAQAVPARPQGNVYLYVPHLDVLTLITDGSFRQEYEDQRTRNKLWHAY
jgi:hypothetical protein